MAFCSLYSCDWIIVGYNDDYSDLFREYGLSAEILNNFALLLSLFSAKIIKNFVKSAMYL